MKILMILFCLFLSVMHGGDLTLSNNTAFQIPLGAQNDTRLTFKLPLFKSESVLFSDSYISIALQNRFSPAYNYSAVRIGIEPIAIFDMNITYGYFYAFSALGYGFVELDSYQDDFSPDTVSNADKFNSSGTYLMLNPNFKIAFGNIIFMNSFYLNLWDMRTNNYFYERISISVLKAKDRNYENETYLLFKYKEHLFGLMNYIMYVPGSKYTSERINLIGILRNPIKGMCPHHFVLISGIYLKDKYEKYYLALLFGVNVGLWKK